MKNTVKDERLKKQLTQVQLAELTGVSRQTIFSIEINRYVPSVMLSLKLAKALGKKVEDLFQLEASDK
jgi:putative transcriptional regulator